MDERNKRRKANQNKSGSTRGCLLTARLLKQHMGKPGLVTGGQVPPPFPGFQANDSLLNRKSKLARDGRLDRVETRNG
jgi:hypothetical protein